MVLLDYPKNVQDRSTEKGFQWTFACEVCGNGFTTTFAPSASAAKARKMGFLGRGAQVLGSVTGQSALWGAGDAATTVSDYSQMSPDWHKEHDAAFTQAVNESKGHFKKCPKCKRFVDEDDWNGEAGLCTEDAPDLATEMQAAMAQARIEQMQEHVRAQKLYTGEAVEPAARCSTCGEPPGSGKFCQNCGAPLGPRECPNCHHPNAPTVKFCGECGTKL